MTIEGKRILILGLAREGESLARFLAERGALVTITDAAPASRLEPRLGALTGLPVDFALGGDHPELIAGAEAFFVSPGVPESNPVYEAARDAGLPIQSMTTLFFDLCPAPIVGITGSSGKTTTTGLIGHILRTAGREVVVGGNIGDPMLDLLPRIHDRTIVVLELSSFQLAILRKSPHIAVVTNISPNHLDRHGTMERYVEAKRNIVRHQTGTNWAVLNAADAHSSGFAGATPARVRWFGPEPGRRLAATVHEGFAGVARDLAFEPVLGESEIPLLGRHNVENVLAALATTDIIGIDPEDMAEGVRTYRAAPHRLQTVAEWRGVRYVDDSIATSPARAAVALHSIDAPVLLIAGGRDKNLPWDDFARLAVQKVSSLFLIGEAADEIERAVRRQIRAKRGRLLARAIHRCSSLEEAVTMASRLAISGDVVLLSPACASYDMFRDFEERGQVFARTVETLDAA
jgi:UDP-N-acetylmuramoylalanine--D-glutamate ligase